MRIAQHIRAGIVKPGGRIVRRHGVHGRARGVRMGQGPFARMKHIHGRDTGRLGHMRAGSWTARAMPAGPCRRTPAGGVTARRRHGVHGRARVSEWTHHPSPRMKRVYGTIWRSWNHPGAPAAGPSSTPAGWAASRLPSFPFAIASASRMVPCGFQDDDASHDPIHASIHPFPS